MRTKVIIVHGWMHSAKRYLQLKSCLEKCGNYQVTLFECPGFGDTKPVKYKNLLEYYSDELAEILAKDKFDYAIGHSMGGNLLLRAMEKKPCATSLILLSPEYHGINLLKPLSLLVPVMPVAMLILKNIRNGVTTFLIKCMSLLTINKWNKIDNQIVEDVRKASPLVASIAMLELIWDSWHVSEELWKEKEVTIIYGENDRIITRKKMVLLRKKIKKCKLYQIPEIGHTAVVEAFPELLNMLKKLMSET